MLSLGAKLGLPPSIPPSFPPSVLSSLPSLPPSVPPVLPSLPPSLPPSLRPSFPPSFPFFVSVSFSRSLFFLCRFLFLFRTPSPSRPPRVPGTQDAVRRPCVRDLVAPAAPRPRRLRRPGCGAALQGAARIKHHARGSCSAPLVEGHTDAQTWSLSCQICGCMLHSGVHGAHLYVFFRFYFSFIFMYFFRPSRP